MRRRRAASATADALQLTSPGSQVSVTAPEASWSVALKDHFPDTRVRDEVTMPLTFPSRSVVVPSSFRIVCGPNRVAVTPPKVTPAAGWSPPGPHPHPPP